MKMSKKIVIMFLVTVLVLCNMTTAFAQTSNKAMNFKDVKGHWAEKHIANLYNLDIINGYGDNTFRPNNKIRRDEFIKMVVEASGHRVEKGTSYWAKPYIDKALELRIIFADDFPDYQAYIKREEMAYIVVNALAIKEELPNVSLETFIKDSIKDYARISNEYKQFVIWSYGYGVISGTPNGTFNPQGNATRAEATTIISRYLDKNLRSPFQAPKGLASIDLENVMGGIHFKGEPVTAYAPTRNGKTINELIDTAHALKDAVNLTKGYGDIRYNTFENVIASSFYLNKEMVEENRYVGLTNIALKVDLLGWSETNYRMSPYEIVIWDMANTERLHKEVIEAMFKHLFENDYKKAIEQYNKYVDTISNSSTELRTKFTWNGRTVHFDRFEYSNTLEIFISLKK